jgi:mannosylglycerate hydrolase
VLDDQSTVAPQTDPELWVYYHTHWDREWYLPFRQYQYRLAQVVSQVIARLQEGVIDHFVLDGQTALLGDVLELRPDLAMPLQHWISSQALSIGPWWVMPDEFLVSGESLLRNLAKGITDAKQWGCHQFTGYLPDTFGHSADMPLILRHVGLQSAVVWRGITPERCCFKWTHPSGQSLTVLHLTDGYFQDALVDNVVHNHGFSTLEPTPINVIELARLNQLSEWFSKITPKSVDNKLLLPLGGDHIGPPTANTIALLKQFKPVRCTTPAQFIETLTPQTLASLATVSGPLVDQSGAFLLPGTWSARLYLKQANRQLEHRLTRWVEPLLAWQAALFSQLNQPESANALTLAWEQLLLNHPHDSICGCSIDSVHRENEQRFDQVAQLSDSIMDATRYPMGKQLFTTANKDHWVAWNMGDRPHRGVVPVASNHADNWSEASSDELFEQTGLHQLQQASSILIEDYRYNLQIVPLAHRTTVRHEGWIWLDDPIPPFGVVSSHRHKALPPDITPAHGRLDTETGLPIVHNQFYWISLQRPHPNQPLALCLQDLNTGLIATQVFSLTLRPDHGDSYNSSPYATDAVMTATLSEAKLEHLGPLVASMVLTYRWEACPEFSPVQLTVMLTADNPVMQVVAKTVPNLPNYQLQLRITMPDPLQSLWLESHFSLQERPIVTLPAVPVLAQKNQELPTATHPLQRFLVAGFGKQPDPDTDADKGAEGNDYIQVVTDGLTEAETVADGIGITLWRGFSHLSKADTGARGAQAGPPLATPEGQGLGRAISGRVGLCLLPAGFTPSHNVAHLWDKASQFYGLVSAEPGTASASDTSQTGVPAHCLLRWDNAQVVSSACYQHTLKQRVYVVLRLLNPTAQAQAVRLSCGFPVMGLYTGNALGDDLQPLVAQRTTLPPHTLQTLWIDITPSQAGKTVE